MDKWLEALQKTMRETPRSGPASEPNVPYDKYLQC